MSFSVRVEPAVSIHTLNRPAWAQELKPSRWRRTDRGWVDTNRWSRPQRLEFERRIELFHPLAVSAMILMLSLCALIWASEEFQWSRLGLLREMSTRPRTLVD